MSATERLAQFVVKTALADAPPAALRGVRRTVLDALAAMLAGAPAPAARTVREVVRAEGGTALCTIVGTSMRTSPTWAAFANGVAGSAGESDEDRAVIPCPTGPVVAAALACAEADLADGAGLVVGCVVGLEIVATLTRARAHDGAGRDGASSIATLGATAAAARIAALDAAQTRHALALAASLACGAADDGDSITKRYRAGHQARDAVVVVRLAREGITATPRQSEGTRSDAAVLGQSLDEPDRQWRIGAPTLAAACQCDDSRTGDALRARFVECAAPITGRAEAQELAQQIEHLEDVPDVRVLTSQLAGSLV